MNIPVNYSLKIQLSLLKSYAVRFVKRRHAGNSLFLPDADKIWQLRNNFGVIVVLGWLPLFSKHSLAHDKIIIAVEGLNGPFEPGDLNLALTRCSLPGTFKLFHYCSLVWQLHLNKQNHFMIKWRFSNVRQCSSVSFHGLWLYRERMCMSFPGVQGTQCQNEQTQAGKIFSLFKLSEFLLLLKRVTSVVSLLCGWLNFTGECISKEPFVRNLQQIRNNCVLNTLCKALNFQWKANGLYLKAISQLVGLHVWGPGFV